MKTGAILAVLAVFLAGCGPRFPAETAFYRAACESAKSGGVLPAGARVSGLETAGIFVGKSAARVDLPYDFADAVGRKETGVYTVWFRNMAHTWEVDRAYRTPSHAGSGAATN
jgi:hypothetical protein